MFRALLAYLQEALHKQLVHCVRVVLAATWFEVELVFTSNLVAANIYTYNILKKCLTLNLLTTTIVAPPSNASKWQMGINSVFKGMYEKPTNTPIIHSVY